MGEWQKRERLLRFVFCIVPTTQPTPYQTVLYLCFNWINDCERVSLASDTPSDLANDCEVASALSNHGDLVYRKLVMMRVTTEFWSYKNRWWDTRIFSVLEIFTLVCERASGRERVHRATLECAITEHNDTFIFNAVSMWHLHWLHSFQRRHEGWPTLSCNLVERCIRLARAALNVLLSDATE